MRRRAARPETEQEQATRFAWWASFLVTLVVVGLLSVAHSAQAAAPAASAGAPFANLAFEDLELEPEGEEDWEEEGEEDCVWDEEEEEIWCEEELEEAEAGERGLGAGQAERCIVTSASARVAARPGRDRLDLTVRYRGERGAAVAISWRLKGRKGKLSLGTERARFTRSGTFRHRETGLSDAEMTRALAAREFRVEVRALNTPASCRRKLTSRLDGHRGATWFERAGKRR